MNEANDYFETVLLPPIRQYISDLRTLLAGDNPAIKRLLELGETYDRIADLGCGNGNRTIPLMLKLRAVEIVGIDKDQDEVDQALAQNVTQLLAPFKQDIQKIRQIVGEDDQITSRLSADVRGEVEDLEEYENIPIPDYRSGNITQGRDSTGLQRGYYDLAYCRYVLYHIYCEERGTSYPNTRLAIQEMVEIVRPGGLVVAYEPNACSPNDSTHVDSTSLFKQREELQLVEQVVSDDDETVYIYRRE